MKNLEEFSGLEATKKATWLTLMPGSAIDIGYELWRQKSLTKKDIKKIAYIELPRFLAYTSGVYHILDEVLK